jgi:hypothetical protein
MFRVASKPLNLAAFLALAQHEVQKAIEYLSLPEVRGEGPQAPAQIFAQLGTIRLSVPVRYAVGVERARQGRKARRDPREILQPGMPWPPDGRPQMRCHLHVRTVGECAEEGGCGPAGKLEIEFITCLKR